MSKVRITRKGVEKLAIELEYSLNTRGAYCILNNKNKSVKKLGFSKAYSYLYNQKRYWNKKKLNVA